MENVILIQEVESSTFSIASIRPYAGELIDWLGRKVQWIVEGGDRLLQSLTHLCRQVQPLVESLYRMVEKGIKGVWRKPTTRVVLCAVIGVVLLYHACYRPTMAKWARITLLIGGVVMIFFAGVLASQSGLISLPEALLSVT